MEPNELLEKYTYVIEENARIKKLNQTVLDRKTECLKALQDKEHVSEWGIMAALTMIFLLILLVFFGWGALSGIVSFFSREIALT